MFLLKTRTIRDYPLFQASWKHQIYTWSLLFALLELLRANADSALVKPAFLNFLFYLSIFSLQVDN